MKADQMRRNMRTDRSGTASSPNILSSAHVLAWTARTWCACITRDFHPAIGLAPHLPIPTSSDNPRRRLPSPQERSQTSFWLPSAKEYKDAALFIARRTSRNVRSLTGLYPSIEL
jgi:hypothetical protein